MQSLPTEAGPLSHCSQCGKRVQPGGGSPTFVYGVGAVGHQSCAACGAKWRYLWHEQPTAVKKSRRPFAVVVGLLLIGGVGVVAVVAFRGSAKRYGAVTTATTVPRSSTTAAPVVDDAALRGDFTRIFEPAATEKQTFMQWLRTSASAIPIIDVNRHVTTFVSDGRAMLTELSAVSWPEPVAGHVKDLDTAYSRFLDDVDLVRFGKIYSQSYLDQLKVESQAVRDAAAVVRSDLGLPPRP